MLLILFAAHTAQAAEDYHAESCSAVKIQDAITQCEEDIECGAVYLPECDAEDLWATGQNVTANISRPWKLIGAGKDKTKIGYEDYASYNSEAMFEITGGGLYDIGHFSIRGSDVNEPSETHQTLGARVGLGMRIWCHTPSGGCDSDLRIHHMKIQKFYGTALNVCWAPGKTILIDNNDIGDQQISTSGRGYMYGVRVYGPNRREEFLIPAEFGEDAPDAVYIEQNNFDNNYHAVSNFSVAQTVIRHNAFSNPSSFIDGHGACYDVGCGSSLPDGYRTGTYRVEIYNNTIDCGAYPWGVNIRGGTGIVTDNTFTNCAIDMRLEMETCAIGPDCTTANGCPHSGDDTSKCYQTPYPWWIWNNTGSEGGEPFSYDGHECIRENHEYYLRAPQDGDPVTSFSKFTFPHPLSSGSDPNPNPNPDPAPDPVGGQSNNDSDSSPCFITAVGRHNP